MVAVGGISLAEVEFHLIICHKDRWKQVAIWMLSCNMNFYGDKCEGSYSNEYWFFCELMSLSADILYRFIICKKLSLNRLNTHDVRLYQHCLTKLRHFFHFFFVTKASFFKIFFTTASLVQQRRYKQHWLLHLKICCFWQLQMHQHHTCKKMWRN